MSCTVTVIKLQYTLQYCILHKGMQSAVKTTLLGGRVNGRAGRGGKHCARRNKSFVLQKQQLWQKPRLKIPDNTKLDTHTHTLPYTSDHIVTQAVTYITYNKHNRRISMPSAGFEPAIAEINQLQPTPHTVWPPIGRYILM